ncbi:hypothetical protein [Streptacidiphilus neutrinimicus]|uniref:hypothetical protein n=1 Tax=Streptacidiphilus neutrinimicus TaxID=105420 RepID=UPI0005A74AF3|nr:hypothetical protein [Streptacidiphilus neutrinimicus]
MNAKKMLISLIPWALFSVIVQRRGADAAGYAALAATAGATWLIIKDKASGIKVIDATGVATFLVLAVAAFAGGHDLRVHIADYGRGASTLALAVVMLASVPVLPFTEQYARETVPLQHRASSVFRSVNRRISAAWGLAVLVIAGLHLLAGHLTAAGTGTHTTNVLLNWAAPVGLSLAAIAYTNHTASDGRPASPAPRAE